MRIHRECLNRLVAAGIERDDAIALRRIAMTLHRWHELECGMDNGHASYCIERDETTGKPYMVFHPYSGRKPTRSRIPDRENGARKRLNSIMAKYLGTDIAGAYVQSDPRGAALYILRKGDVPEGADVDAYYSRGIAVYK